MKVTRYKGLSNLIDDEISFEKSKESKKLEAVNIIVESNLSNREKIVLLELMFSL